MKRPDQGDYAPFYQKYIDLTRGSNMVQNMEDSANMLIRLMEEMPENKRGYSYAPNKWTVHQLIQHIVDCDVVFYYRALWMGRGGEKLLKGFDENAWADKSLDDLTPWDELLSQFKSIRSYGILLFKNFSEQTLETSAQMSGHNTKLRSIAFISAGHTFHHINILKDRYL